MLSLCAKKITSVFTRANIINEEDEEIYIYSFEILLSSIINFAIFCTIAIAVGRVWETLFFFIGFLPIRKLSGGYHADTHFRCFLVSLGTYLIFLALISFIPAGLYIGTVIISSLISASLIWALSPVDSSNKPLSPEEKVFFRRRSRITILIYVLSIIPMIIFITKIELLSLSIGVLSVAVSLVAARIKHKFYNMNSMAQSQE